ncbi:unnamed protein product [Clavelina lepadiformis]|uniref:Uncharacterized protein n=1 Tax=Clavelina lepadiformis TaxID=159417 RepID=A0ABP0FMM7_CLALP
MQYCQEETIKINVESSDFVEIRRSQLARRFQQRRRRAGLKQKRHEGNKQNQQSTLSSSVVALTSSHIHRQDPSQHDGNEPQYFDGNLINENDQSNELASLDVYDVIHVLGDQQDDANEPI